MPQLTLYFAPASRGVHRAAAPATWAAASTT